MFFKKLNNIFGISKIFHIGKHYLGCEQFYKVGPPYREFKNVLFIGETDYSSAPSSLAKITHS